jgi:hypothetical protein
MLAAMTTMPLQPPTAACDLGTLLQRLDGAGLQLRISEPGKVVSVYATSPEATAAVTDIARAGRAQLPQLGWTLEFSPAETVLILTGPDDALGSLGVAAEYPEAC